MAANHGTQTRWVGHLRKFIATGAQDLKRQACAECSDEHLRTLLVKLDPLSPGALVESEAYVEHLARNHRQEEAAALRLLMLTPAARAIKEARQLVPNGVEVVMPLCSTGAELATMFGFRECEAFFLSTLGAYERLLGDAERAEAHLSQALTTLRELARDEPDLYALSLAEVLDEAGKLYAARGDLATAKAAFAEGITSCSAGQPDGTSRRAAMRALLLLDMGNVREHLNEPESAAAFYTEAIGIWEVLAAQEPDQYELPLAGALCNLGQLHLHRGELGTAKSLLTRSIPIWQQLQAFDRERFEPHLARTRALLSRIAQLERTQSGDTTSPATTCPCGRGQAFRQCHGSVLS